MSVKIYSYKKDKEKSLSKHFKVKEFASTSKNKVYSDNVLIESALIDTLEELFLNVNLKISKIIITSGYRTSAHDKAVGGSGNGAHVVGKAADFICYDKNNKIISAKKICCALEDMKAKGIGYISENATHLDMNYRNNRWWGDETKAGQHDISYYKKNCNSFYDYFGVGKQSSIVKEKTSDETIKKGSTVKIKSGAKDLNTKKKLSLFAYARKYIVSSVTASRCVLTYGGTVVSAIDKRDLTLVK